MTIKDTLPQAIEPRIDPPAAPFVPTQAEEDQLNPFAITDSKEGQASNYNPEFKDITEELLKASPNLRSLGAAVGDQITPDNKLNRVNSIEPRGKVITEELIEASPNLQKLEAEPGDFIDENNKLIKSGSNDWWQNFNYDFKTSRNLFQKLAIYADSIAPLGEIRFFTDDGIIDYVSAAERFGKENPTKQEVLDFYATEMANEVAELTKDFEPSADVSGGSIAKAILDPTIVLPIARGATGAMTTGAAYGAVDETLNQLTTSEGEITAPDRIMLATAIGTMGGSIIEQGAGALKARGTAKVKKQLEELEQQQQQPKNDQVVKAAIKEEAIANPVQAKRFAGVRQWLGTIQEEVSALVPNIGGRLIRMEADTMMLAGRRINRIQPFVDGMRQLPKDVYDTVGMHLQNQNYKAAVKVLNESGHGNLVKPLKQVERTLKVMDRENRQVGLYGEGLANYFPRMVDDLKGLVESQGKEFKEGFDALIEQAAGKGGKFEDLPMDRQFEIANRVARGEIYKRTGVDGKRSWQQQRTVDEIAPEQMQYYKDPMDTLLSYVERATAANQKRKFFGQTSKNLDDGTLDIPESIGMLLAKESQDLAPEAQRQLRELLQARFVAGGKGRGEVASGVANIGYLGTLADMVSALTQLADPAQAAALYGIKETVKSILPGANKIKTTDLGIEKIIVEEFADASHSKIGKGIAKTLDYAFAASGFKLIDRIGKQAILNGAHKQFVKLAMTSKGRAKLRQRYGNIFPDMDLVIRDLASGQRTMKTDALALAELGNLQPIFKSGLPAAAMKSDAARLVYMMKTFTIMAWNAIRVKGVKEWKAGNKKEALTNVTKLVSYMTAANIGTGYLKDLAKGRDIDRMADDLPDRALWAMLGIYGFNKYTADRLRTDPERAIQDYLIPPFPVLDISREALRSMSAAEKRSLFDKVEENEKWVASAPVVGQLMYNWFFGGREAYNAKLPGLFDEVED